MHTISRPFSGLLLLVIFLVIHSCSKQKITLTVDAGEYARPSGAAVKFPVPDSSGITEFTLVKNLQSGDFSPVQRWGKDHLIFILEEPILKGETAEFRLLTGDETPEASVQLDQDDRSVSMKIKGKTLLTYHTATVEPPESEPAYYRRSGFIHPLYSPDGKMLTDGFPVGHTHQHGIFMAWVKTLLRSDTIDFWNQHKEQGTVRHISVDTVEQGAVFARFEATLNFVSTKYGEVLEDRWEVTGYNYSDHFVFDITSRQRCLTDDTLFLLPHIYGGMAFRGSREWNKEDSLHFEEPMQVLTSLGDDREKSNHTRPAWVSAYGKISGATAGIAIMGHPENFRYPQPVRVHPEMPYFCKAPIVEEGFAISPDEIYLSRYRFVVFDGEADSEFLNAISEDFEHPVRTTISGW